MAPNIFWVDVDLGSILIGFICCFFVMLFVTAQLPKPSVSSNSLFFKENVIGSLEDYYEILYYFIYDNLFPVMIFRRDYGSNNRFELLTKTGQIGVIRTYTMNIDSMNHSESKWFIERETCILIINDLEELNIRTLVVTEKERYERLNLRLVSERNIFNHQAIELIAVRENSDLSLDDDMYMNPPVSFYNGMFNLDDIDIKDMDEDDDSSNDSLD